MNINSIAVRPLKLSDRRSVWEWRLNPISEVIKPVDAKVTYGSFCQWFNSFLQQTPDVMLVGEIAAFRVGLVWFCQIGPKRWEVVHFVKPAYSGFGAAPVLLKRAIEYFTVENDVSYIYSKVPRINPASGYEYSAAGFQITVEDEFLQCEFKPRSLHE